MKPNTIFLRKPKSFWASVRTISQSVGYTDRRTGQIKVPSTTEIRAAFKSLGLNDHSVVGQGGLTELGQSLQDYFEYRAHILNHETQHSLMTADQAEHEFNKLIKRIPTDRMHTMNKQKGDKKKVAYLTAMVGLLIEDGLKGLPCNFDPRELTTVTLNGTPLRTLARRVDGAFPSPVNPIAIWEIKEYYYTTTFGSRVADGVYETLLDGMELEELREHEGVDVKHYLMADAHYTWWTCGKSYLCRMVDMLHMGYVDEILFGREVISEMPRIVSEWVELYNQGLATT